jgi:hypothetical protein
MAMTTRSSINVNPDRFWMRMTSLPSEIEGAALPRSDDAYSFPGCAANTFQQITAMGANGKRLRSQAQEQRTSAENSTVKEKNR